MLVFSIMDQVEKEVNAAKKENLSNSNNFQDENIHNVFTPISKSVPDSFQSSIENILTSDHLEKNEEIAKPLKENNPGYGKLFTEEAAHLFREACECGRMKLWTKGKSANQEPLLSHPTKNSLVFDIPSTENRQDKLSSIIIIIVTVCTILFLFWIRNIDMIMNSDS